MTNIYLANNKGMKEQQHTMQIGKGKKSSGLPLLQRLDLSRALKGDIHAIQLSQSSYLKDLKFLNLCDCKLGQKSFNDILASPNLRSLEVLLCRKNKFRTVEGPHSDLEDLDERTAKKGAVMKLSLLDIRENKIQNIFLKDALTFLRDTVVIMWDNPFEESKQQMAREYYDPSYLFRASELEDDYRLIQNPLHIFKASEETKLKYQDLLD